MSAPLFTIYPRPSLKNLSKLRKKGFVPGIMYGQSLHQAIPIQIELTKLLTIINTPHQSIFHLTLDEVPYDCILREFQTDPLCSFITHVDFQFVKPNEVTTLAIPVRYEGVESLRAKKLLLETTVSKVPVRGPIQNLPDAFAYPVDRLDKGSKIFAHSLQLPEDTELLLASETILATIQ